jgi:hypothetical protein
LDPDVALLEEAAATKASFLAHLKLYHGLALDSSDPQFTFVGKVGSATATILIDTGANASFVSEQFARRHSLQTVPSSRHTVELANGETQQTASAVLPSASLGIRTSTGTYQTTLSDLLVLPLGHYDVILGDDWIKAARAMLDGAAGLVLLPPANGHAVCDSNPSITLTAGETRPPALSQLISLSALRRVYESKQIDEIYLVRVTCADEAAERPPAEEGKGAAPDPELSALEAALRAEFADIIVDGLPPGIPPARDVDHEIPLEPDAKPVPRQPTRRLSPARRVSAAAGLPPGKGFHPPQQIRLRRKHPICPEEGWLASHVHRLPSTQQAEQEEQVPAAPYRRSARQPRRRAVFQQH